MSRAPRLSSWSRLFAAGVALLLALRPTGVLHGQARPASRTYVLNETGVFGSDPVTAPKSSLPNGGTVFAGIVGVAEGPGGTLYVLDRDYKKVVVFNRDGSVRHSFGRFGTAQGEFSLPVALDVTTSSVWVYDYELSRITEFDLKGGVKRTIKTPVPARSIRVVDDGIWLTPLPTKKQLAVRVDSTGEIVERGIPVTAADLDYTPRLVAHAGRATDGTLLVAHHIPGLWFRRSKGGFSPYGSPAFVLSKSVIINGTVKNGGDTWGIGQLPDRRVVILYSKHNVTSRNFSTDGYFLDVSNEKGERLGTVKLPFSFVMSMGVSSKSGDIYIATAGEPFPRVIRYSLKER